MPRDLDLTFDISTGALTLDRVVGNYVKRSETLTLSVTIVSNGASATIPSGLVGTLKPVNTYGTTLSQWTTFSQVGATNVYTASTTINAAAVSTLLGTTTEQANCVFDFAGDGVVESDTLALVLKNNVTRDDDTAPTALLNRNDFLVSNGTGLLVNVAAGYAANGAFVAAQSSLAITNATNYIEVTAAGVASVNTTAFTAGSYPLATVVASAGAITANTDLRAWITPKPAAAGGVSDGDKGDITVSNSGATWTIDNDTITLAKLAHMTTARVVGRTTAGTGTPELLTISGTGSVAMTTSPSFTTPDLGTPSAIVLTNASGTASININGTVGATTPSTVAGTTGTFTGTLTVNNITYANNSVVVSNPSTPSAGIDINPYNSGTQVTSGHPWMRLGGGSSDTLVINAGAAGSWVDICADLGSGLIIFDGTGGHSTYLTTPATGTLRLTTNGSTLGALDVGTITASSTTSLLLGTAGSAVGNIGFRNATSGTTTLAPATGALGTQTVTLPLSGTLAISSGAQTFTGVQSMTSPDITTSITTPSTTFALVNATATTVNFAGGASTALNMGNASGTNTVLGANVLSTAGAESKPVLNVSGVPFAGTGTTSFPLVYINDANATASSTLNTAGTYLGINIDGTQDGINVLKDGVSKFKVDSAGKITSTSDRILLGNGGFIYWDGTNWGVYTQTVSNAPFTCGTLALNGHTTVGVNNVYDLGTASLGFRDLWVARNGTIGGTLAVTGTSTFTGDIIAGSATMALLNTTATTVNLAGAATAINIGAATATLKLGTATSTSTATPAIFDCGGTYADTVTSAKAKWKLYSDGTAINTYGIGISLSKFNFFTASSAAYSFLFADVEKANLSNAGLLTLQGGLIATTGAFSSTLAVTGATTLTGNLTSNGALISTPQALSGAGAVNVTTLTTAFTSTGAAQALSLADGTSGQLKTISHVVDGGSGVLTPTTKSGYTTITFTNVGDSVTLQYHTTAGWCIVGVFGAVPA